MSMVGSAGLVHAPAAPVPGAARAQSSFTVETPRVLDEQFALGTQASPFARAVLERHLGRSSGAKPSGAPSPIPLGTISFGRVVSPGRATDDACRQLRDGSDCTPDATAVRQPGQGLARTAALPWQDKRNDAAAVPETVSARHRHASTPSLSKVPRNCIPLPLRRPPPLPHTAPHTAHRT